MVGGLQGEKWKFIQKYLKKRSKRVGAQISQFACRFRTLHGDLRKSRKLISQLGIHFRTLSSKFASCKINFASWASLWLCGCIPFPFRKGAKLILHSLALCHAACTPLGHFTSLQKFRIAMQNCWMLDFFSDSLPNILDWFGKGYEALQNLDSSCVWASTCFAMDYTKFSLILGSF